MKYLKKFNNHTEYEEARQNLVLPNVSYCVSENEVHYNPYKLFCKLTLNDSVVKIDGSGELTRAMISSYTSTLVSAEIGEACTSIGDSAFNRCGSLTSVTIPNSVVIIGNYAFYADSELTSITIPDSVISIGVGVFNQCSGLTSVTVLATNPPILGSYAFSSTNNCPIYVPSESVNAYKAISGWSSYRTRIQPIPTT